VQHSHKRGTSSFSAGLAVVLAIGGRSHE
jgi:hypothetical protein